MVVILVSLLFGLAFAAAIGAIVLTLIPNFARIRDALMGNLAHEELPVHIRRTRSARVSNATERLMERPRAAA